jgi:hypothetical protein
MAGLSDMRRTLAEKPWSRVHTSHVGCMVHHVTRDGINTVANDLTVTNDLARYRTESIVNDGPRLRSAETQKMQDHAAHDPTYVRGRPRPAPIET